MKKIIFSVIFFATLIFANNPNGCTDCDFKRVNELSWLIKTDDKSKIKELLLSHPTLIDIPNKVWYASNRVDF